MDDIVGINRLLLDLKDEKGLDIPMHVDGASGGVRVAVPLPGLASGTSGSSRCARSTCRATSTAWSTRASAGWSSARRPTCAEDLVFYENYLGKTDATFTLNFSTGAAMVLAQYYNFVRLGRDGYTLRHAS